MYLNTTYEVRKDAMEIIPKQIEEMRKGEGIRHGILGIYVHYMQDVIAMTYHHDEFDSTELRASAFRVFDQIVKKEGLKEKLLEAVRLHGSTPGDKGDYYMYVTYHNLSKSEEIVID